MDKETLSKLTVVKLKEIAKSKGLTRYSLLKKQDLINLILENAVVRQRRASVTPVYSSFIDECMANPIEGVKELAESLDIDVDGKRKKKICSELKDILEPAEKKKTTSSKKKSLPNSKKELAETLDVNDCVKKNTKPELIAKAKSKGIKTSGKNKKDLCKELLSSPISTSRSISKISYDNVETIIYNNVVNNDIANELIEEVKDAIDPISVEEKINEIVSETSLNENDARNIVEKEMEIQTVVPIIINAEADNVISKKEATNVINDLQSIAINFKTDEEENVGVEKRKLSVKNISNIEEKLRELKDPELRVSELADVQTKVFQLLGLLH